jgi:hypothetical protein
MGAGTVLSYAIVTELFPKSASGRANGALNLLHIGSAFAVQVTFGLIVDLWPIEAGRHLPMAYQSALGINLALQVAAFLWFVRPKRRAVFARDLSAHPIHALAMTLGVSAAIAIPYLQARQDWRSRQAIAWRQVAAWRSAALVSVVVMAAISSSLLFPASTSAPPHAQFTSRENPTVAAAHSMPARMIAYLRSMQ